MGEWTLKDYEVIKTNIGKASEAEGLDFEVQMRLLLLADSAKSQASLAESMSSIAKSLHMIDLTLVNKQ